MSQDSHLSDPNYHWNGEQWLWWNGNQWIEIGVATQAKKEEPNASKSSPRESRQRLKTIANVDIEQDDLRTHHVVGTDFYDGIGKVSARDKQATLLREPNNEYDKNAVAVYVGGRKLGHLASGAAEEYAPILDHAGGKLVVNCAVTGQKESRSVDVLLPRADHLALLMWEQSDPQTRGEKPSVRRRVKLVRLGSFQENLERHQAANRARLVPTLRGANCVVGDDIIGVVTDSELARHPILMNAPEDGIDCEVTIREYPQRWWAVAFVDS